MNKKRQFVWGLAWPFSPGGGSSTVDPPADPPADIKKMKRKLKAPCRKYVVISFRMKIWIRENKFLNRKKFLIRLWGYHGYSAK